MQCFAFYISVFGWLARSLFLATLFWCSQLVFVCCVLVYVSCAVAGRPYTMELLKVPQRGGCRCNVSSSRYYCCLCVKSSTNINIRYTYYQNLVIQVVVGIAESGTFRTHKYMAWLILFNIETNILSPLHFQQTNAVFSLLFFIFCSSVFMHLNYHGTVFGLCESG